MIERYYRELLNYLMRTLADRSAAADLAQESYARVYAAQLAGGAIRDERAFLYRTARNLAIDRHRYDELRQGAERAVGESVSAAEELEQPGPPALEPEVALSSSRAVAAMVAVIEQMPLRRREAFMLNRFDGLSYAEVAQRMAISVKAVEQHIRHALDACERCRAGDEAPAGRA